MKVVSSDALAYLPSTWHAGSQLTGVGGQPSGDAIRDPKGSFSSKEKRNEIKSFVLPFGFGGTDGPAGRLQRKKRYGRRQEIQGRDLHLGRLRADHPGQGEGV